MTKAEFAVTLQGAVAGRHENLEVILELYTFDEVAAMLLEMAGYTGEAANE